MDGEKAKRQKCFRLAETQLIYGSSEDKKQGIIVRKSSRPHFSKTKITNWQAFPEFAEGHGDKTQAQMASLWGEPISPRTISRGLKKIGFTRKKKDYGYEQRDENKRNEFLL